MNLRRTGRTALRLLDRLSWIEVAMLAGLTVAVALNAAAGTWVAVGLLLTVALLFLAAVYWRTECEAEAASHDHTLHQLDEARAEVRRLSGDVVRWGDLGGQR